MVDAKITGHLVKLAQEAASELDSNDIDYYVPVEKDSHYYVASGGASILKKIEHIAIISGEDGQQIYIFHATPEEIKSHE